VEKNHETREGEKRDLVTPRWQKEPTKRRGNGCLVRNNEGVTGGTEEGVKTLWILVGVFGGLVLFFFGVTLGVISK